VYTDMKQWTEIRRRVLVEGASKRSIQREYGLHWKTLEKILTHIEPPGYRISQGRRKRKLERFLPVIDEILRADTTAPRKQRHTAKRIFDRMRAEHGYTGGITVVKEAVRAWRRTHAEVFIPLRHPPGEAQVDFGRATVGVAGESVTVAMFVMTLPYSDGIFCCVFPRECTEAFQEGHVRAFTFFGVHDRLGHASKKLSPVQQGPGRHTQGSQSTVSQPQPLRQSRGPVIAARLPTTASGRPSFVSEERVGCMGQDWDSQVCQICAKGNRVRGVPVPYAGRAKTAQVVFTQ